MKSLNKVLLIGNVGKEPTLRTTPTGKTVLNFSVATNESFKDKSGQWQNIAEWHYIAIWGKTAEYLSEILSKGNSVFVEGAIKTNTWEDKDGTKHKNTQIVASNVLVLEPKEDSPKEDDDEITDDDIPF